MVKQSAPEKDHRKPCTLCHQPRNVLVRCQIDASGKWNFVCPGKCWRSVSGGVVDGARKGVGTGSAREGGSGEESAREAAEVSDADEEQNDCGAEHGSGTVAKVTEGMGSKWYRYGGMWKNKHEGASAKMPRRVKREIKEHGRAGNGEPVDADVKEADGHDGQAPSEILEAG